MFRYLRIFMYRFFFVMQYVIKTVEVESFKIKQVFSEFQVRNQYLQEQVVMQRQVLKEMEQQLQSSYQLIVQFRAQVRRSCEGVRWVGKLEAGLRFRVGVEYLGVRQIWVLVFFFFVGGVIKGRFCLSRCVFFCIMI